MKTLLNVAALALLLGGCAHYSKTLAPEALPRAAKLDLDILAKSGATYSLKKATVGTDAVIGGGWKYYPDGGKEVFDGRIAFADISLVKTHEIDRVGTLLAWGAIGVLAVATADGGGVHDGINVDIRYPSTGSGSCPLVFAWDGERYRFESETFAGAYGEALEFTQKECLTHLVPEHGRLRLVLANNAPESHHTNRIALFALDHPRGTEVRLGAAGEPYSLREAQPPVRASAYDSVDVLPLVSTLGDGAWESDLERTDRVRDGLVCEFAIPVGARRAKLRISAHNTGMGEFALHKLLAMRGPGRMKWCYEMSSDTSEVRKFRAWQRREGGLEVQVAEDSGWNLQGWLPDVGGLVHPERIVPLDLGSVREGVVKVRLDATAGLWFIDRVAIDFSADEPIRETAIALEKANANDGVDVTRPLSEADSLYYATLPGDYATLSYAEVPLKDDQERTYVLISEGYYHPWVEEGPADFKPLLDQVLDVPELGQRLYLPEWKKVKNDYTRLQTEPVFPFAPGPVN